MAKLRHARSLRRFSQGHFFEGEDVAIKAPNGQPILTSAPIVDLLAYLQSLQGS